MFNIFKTWRARRDCFHHEQHSGTSWIEGRLIDLGRRKKFQCRVCGKIWIV